MENFRAKLCIKDLELNRWIFLEAVLAIMLLRSMICNNINILENRLVLLCSQKIENISYKYWFPLFFTWLSEEIMQCYRCLNLRNFDQFNNSTVTHPGRPKLFLSFRQSQLIFRSEFWGESFKNFAAICFCRQEKFILVSRRDVIRFFKEIAWCNEIQIRNAAGFDNCSKSIYFLDFDTCEDRDSVKIAF